VASGGTECVTVVKTVARPFNLAVALPGQGASQVEEAVWADSGLVGEVAARVGWVRRLPFCASCESVILLRYTCGLSKL